MLAILSILRLGYHDIASFIIGSRVEYDFEYALLFTHKTRLVQA